MSTFRLVPLLFVALSVPASASDVNPADYNVTVHVVASHWITTNTSLGTQQIQATIDGQPVELQGESRGVLALGDYKALRVLNDYHIKPNGYDTYTAYVFLFPDGKTRIYQVTGLGWAEAPLPPPPR